MNNIKIEFDHENAKTPKYAIEELIAIKGDCDPQLWLTGKVTGLQLGSNNTYNYTVLLEYPEKCSKEYREDELLTIKEHKREQILYGLGYFTGSQVLFKHWFGFRYTQGVKYIADEAGAYWLIDAICSHQNRTLLNKYPNLKEFQIWRLEVKDDSGLLICEEDTDQPVLSQKIPYTDFPLEEIKFFLIDRIILLPGEY